MKTLALFLLSSLTLSAQVGLRSAGFVAAVMKPSSTTFTPASVPGMQMWFTGTGLVGNEGDFVNNWPSSDPVNTSRYGTNWVDATEQPQITNTFNGKALRALYFNGTTNLFYVSNALTVAKNIDDVSIVAVVSHTDSTSRKGILNINRAGSASGRAELRIDNNNFEWGSVLALDGGSGQSIALAHKTTGAKVIQLDLVYTNRAEALAGSITIYTNNVVGTNVALTLSTNTQNTDSSYIMLGSYSSKDYGFKGWMAEVIVYVPKVSDANRTLLYNYLNTRYR